MTPDRLLDHFDRISDAPDAIPRLRRFILDLAVRGKLVEQDPNDEPASELIKRIQTREAAMLRKSKTKTEPKHSCYSDPGCYRSDCRLTGHGSVGIQAETVLDREH